MEVEWFEGYQSVEFELTSTCSTRFGKLWSFPRTSCTWQCRSTGVRVAPCHIMNQALRVNFQTLAELYPIYPHSIPFQFFDFFHHYSEDRNGMVDKDDNSMVDLPILSFIIFIHHATMLSTSMLCDSTRFHQTFPGATSMRSSKHRWISPEKPSTCKVPWCCGLREWWKMLESWCDFSLDRCENWQLPCQVSSFYQQIIWGKFCCVDGSRQWFSHLFFQNISSSQYSTTTVCYSLSVPGKPIKHHQCGMNIKG